MDVAMRCSLCARSSTCCASHVLLSGNACCAREVDSLQTHWAQREPQGDSFTVYTPGLRLHAKGCKTMSGRSLEEDFRGKSGRQAHGLQVHTFIVYALHGRPEVRESPWLLLEQRGVGRCVVFQCPLVYSTCPEKMSLIILPFGQRLW